MSDGDIRVLSPGDRKLCTSCESGSGNVLVRQEDGDSDDSDSYETDLESAASKPSSPERRRRWSLEVDSSDVYLATCEQDGVAPQVAIVRALPEREINVRHRCLGDQDAHALSVSICRNTTVTHLQLAGNNIGAVGAVYLKTVLTLNQNISFLDLSENNLGRDSAISLSISDALRVNTGLETLILAQNHLRDQDAVYLAAGIQANGHLIRLDLSKNVIAETGAVHIGRALAVNNSIEQLNLSGNCIRQRGAVAVCNGLQENGYVSQLDLSWNGFGYEGALAVGELLKKNSTLTQLDLSSNRINWQAVQFLVDGITHNRTLHTLALDMNPLTTTGCMDLIEAISKLPQTSLTNLSLREVPVLSEFELVTMMIKHNRPEFTCQHGGVVSSADTVGLRREKPATAIQKVMQFMRDHDYRSVEFFRILDIDASRSLTAQQLAERMLKLNVQLKRHEIDELVDFIETTHDAQSSNVSYMSMYRGVKGQQDMERVEKIREKNRDERLRRYHHDILSGPAQAEPSSSDVILPPIHHYDAEQDKEAMLATLKGGARAAPVANTGNGNAIKTGNIMSMSKSLGSKAVPFGKAGGSHKKKKIAKKTAKTKKKQQHKPPINYDDEGVGLP